MKNSVLVILSAFTIGCSQTEEKKTEVVKQKFEIGDTGAKFDTDKFKGRYSGTFGTGILVLQLNYIQGKNASGNNILRGNKRNLKGTVEDRGKYFHFVLNEPGDDKYDGVFEFDIDTSTFVINGKWIPNDTSAAKSKTYTFNRLESHGNTTALGEYVGNIGDRDGNLLIKKNGLCTFTFSVFDENKSTDEQEVWQEVVINGTWIQQGKDITLEFEKNPYLEFYRMNVKVEGEEYSGFLDGGERVSFYSGF